MTRLNTWSHYKYNTNHPCPSSEFRDEMCNHGKKSQSIEIDVQTPSDPRPHGWGNVIYSNLVDSNSLASSFGTKKKVRKKYVATKPRIKRISLREWCQTGFLSRTNRLEKSIAQIDVTSKSRYFEASFCGHFHFSISQLKVRLSITWPMCLLHSKVT